MSRFNVERSIEIRRRRLARRGLEVLERTEENDEMARQLQSLGVRGVVWHGTAYLGMRHAPFLCQLWMPVGWAELFKAMDGLTREEKRTLVRWCADPELLHGLLALLHLRAGREAPWETLRDYGWERLDSGDVARFPRTHKINAGRLFTGTQASTQGKFLGRGM